MYTSMFSSAELKSLIGRAWDPDRDCIAVMNGDDGSADVRVVNAEYYPAGGGALAYIDRAFTGHVRVNFLIVAGA